MCFKRTFYEPRVILVLPKDIQVSVKKKHLLFPYQVESENLKVLGVEFLSLLYSAKFGYFYTDCEYQGFKWIVYDEKQVKILDISGY